MHITGKVLMLNIFALIFFKYCSIDTIPDNGQTNPDELTDFTIPQIMNKLASMNIRECIIIQTYE